MKRAISLARGGSGQVSPNPLVGAVIVKNEKIIGQGYHERYGGKHAEINAIESCNESTNGATLYCNLEPCSKVYPGKHNPPCCDAIIKAKIKRVVISQIDPNPKVQGSGIQMLKSCGLDVTTGIEVEESMELNRGFNSVMRYGRPYIHIKWAQTLDGQIATSSGESKWISSEECRKNAHFHRSLCDGIIVGRRTLELDDPTLDARFGYSPSPRPIIIDPILQTSPDLKIFDRNPVIICSNDTFQKRRSLYRGEILTFPGRSFNISAIMETLKDIGFNSIFVEGGASLITQCLEAELWDRVTVYTAPKLLGNGLSPVGNLPINHPKDAIKFFNSQFEILDNHMVFNGYRVERVLCLQA